MSKLAFLIVSFISVPFFAHSQIAEENNVVIIKETPNAVYENSSEHNRIDKNFEASVIAVGFGPVPGTVGGFTFGYYLNRNSLINLSYVKVRQSAYSCSGSIGCTASGNAIALSYKRFASNSFYYTLGLSRREAGYRETEEPSGVTAYKFNGYALGGEVSIGNQWQWKNFTLGCDWIGFNFPLGYTIESEESSGNSWDVADLESRKKAFLDTTLALGLHFYVGASF
jgi:hypothetical protein